MSRCGGTPRSPPARATAPPRTDPDRRYPSARTVAAALTGFSLWLPTRPGGCHEEPRSSNRDRVLLVDDDPATRRLMAAVLRDQYDVREAEDGDGALRELTRAITIRHMSSPFSRVIVIVLDSVGIGELPDAAA